MDSIAIIPARYNSTRFPGKPLAMIHGKSMIRRVYEQTCKAVENVIVATDDERIVGEVENFGGCAIMTSANCPNGTSRVFEAYRKSGSKAEIVVNVQGDEPLTSPETINALIRKLISDKEATVSTVAQRFDPSDGFEALFNPNRVKMTMDHNGRVLYFSRSIIPYVRGYNWQEWLRQSEFFIHNGLYAFRSETLPSLVGLPASTLEQTESLEQLRWLQNGYRISAVITDSQSHPVDTPEDLIKIQNLLTSDK